MKQNSVESKLRFKQLKAELQTNPNLEIEMWNQCGPFINMKFNLLNHIPSQKLIDFAILQNPLSAILFPTVLFPASLISATPNTTPPTPEIQLFQQSPEWFSVEKIESHCVLNSLIRAKQLSICEFNEMLQDTEAVLSGSAVLYCLRDLPAAERWPSGPSDFDIYINDPKYDTRFSKLKFLPSSNKTAKWVSFLKARNYKLVKTYQTYACASRVNRLFSSVLKFMNSEQSEIQLINVETCPKFHIAKFFDLSYLKNYYDGINFWISNSEYDRSDNYLHLFLELSKYQLANFEMSAEFEKSVRREINFQIKKKRVRLIKYLERGFEEKSLKEFDDMVCSSGIVNRPSTKKKR